MATRTRVWKENRDTGAMFEDTLEIWRVDGTSVFYAVVRDGWGGLQGTRECDSHDAAHRACFDILNESLGLTGDMREGPY